MLQSIPVPAAIRNALPVFSTHAMGKRSALPDLLRRRSERGLLYLRHGLPAFLLLFLCGILCREVFCAQDLDSAVEGLRQRYASVTSVMGNYQQIYRAPGIDQTESGVFWLKRPGLMRWECRQPEEKLFVLDGRQSFHYIPQDYQVYVQPFTAADLHRTPLEILLGTMDIRKSYTVSWEGSILPKYEGTCLIRLTPRSAEPEYAYLVLELDRKTWDLRRLVIRESSGNTSEFLFTNVKTNVKIENSKFRFKPPKGVDVIKLDDADSL